MSTNILFNHTYGIYANKFCLPEDVQTYLGCFIMKVNIDINLCLNYVHQTFLPPNFPASYVYGNITK